MMCWYCRRSGQWSSCAICDGCGGIRTCKLAMPKHGNAQLICKGPHPAKVKGLMGYRSTRTVETKDRLVFAKYKKETVTFDRQSVCLAIPSVALCTRRRKTPSLADQLQPTFLKQKHQSSPEPPRPKYHIFGGNSTQLIELAIRCLPRARLGEACPKVLVICCAPSEDKSMVSM